MDTVPVSITYHKQKSSTARIRDGKIVLRISNLVSRREQQRHIDHLTEKMMGVWDKQEKKVKLSLEPVLRELANHGERGGDLEDVGNLEKGVELLLSTGVAYFLLLKRADVKKTKVQKIGQKVMLLVPVEDEGLDLDMAEEALWKFLVKDQVKVLEQRLDDLREGWLEEEFSKLTLKKVMTRWGSCEKRRGLIMLSVKLLLVEPKLLDYVCVHELAHLRHANHADLFWELVESKMPDWKVQRKRLREYE
ncbi:MAG: M48 family metallopeptidase [Candidatus Gracilibacteria bacterium]|nr:M48 family metallopeptidase [Candidatus Gracilibacteria bacterium]